MDTAEAIATMSALAQPTRYRCLDLLAARQKLTAGELAVELDVPPNLLSSHLSVLAAAGLVTSIRSGRSVIYAAERNRLLELAAHLLTLASEPRALIGKA